MSETLTAREAADKLGLTVHQVYRRLHRGDIPSRTGGRTGQSYLINRADLEAYIEAGQPLRSPSREHTMLKVPEVARITGLSVDKVRQLCREGTLHAIRGGGKNGHLRIHKASVEAYMGQPISA